MQEPAFSTVDTFNLTFELRQMTAGLTLLAHDVGTKKIMHEICVNFVSTYFKFFLTQY